MPSLIPSNALKFSAFSLLLLSGTTIAQTVAPVTGEVSAAQAEIFALPDTVQNFGQLMAFVEEIDSLKPTDDSEQTKIAHQRKVARTVVAVAEIFSSQEISDKDAMQSVFLKLQGLRILQELDEPKASELFAKSIEVALADIRPDVQAVGTKFMVEAGFSHWAVWGEKEKSGLIDRIIEVISSRPPEASQVDLVMSVEVVLGQMNGEVYARQLLSKLIPHFQSSQDVQIQQRVSILQGIERRLSLPGNPIRLTGTLLDGSELDWESYRGKVVLVDFWATWCGPCRADVPNVMKMYQAYHDKGFEVLGISLDDQREEAESYIEQTKIPWPTMFSENPAERGWKNPMAVYYGVSGIPLAILVDREGKVVHMLARGENLNRELRRLLGEPVARSQPQVETLVQQVSNLSPDN